MVQCYTSLYNNPVKIDFFSEIQEDQVIHYLSNFAEVLNAPKMEDLQGWIIKDVEIFKAGTYRKITYTEQDLEDMVKHFKDLKTDGKLDPIFKVNHSEDVRDQIGWILDVRKSGDLLLADIHLTDWTAYDKISSGTWKKVSAEIYLPELAEEEFGVKAHILRAVAVVSIPKVKDIKGIVLNSESWDDPATPGEKPKGEGGNKRMEWEKFLQLLSEMGIQLTDEQKTQLKEKGVEFLAENPTDPPAAGSVSVQGQVVMTADQFVALSEKFSTLEKGSKDLATEIERLTKDSKKAGLEKWIQQLSESGKVLPAEKEEIMSFAETLQGEPLEKYKATFEKRPKLVQFGETLAAQSQEPDTEVDASYQAFQEQYGQKKY
jgi:hypothetical protein